MKNQIIFLLITISLCSGYDYMKHGSDWSNGDCLKNKQSPINIEKYTLPDEPTCLNAKFTFLEPFPLQTVQKVHTLLTLNHDEQHAGKQFIQVDYMDGSKVKSTYKGLQFHLHAKSEHTINGEHYDLELHVVTINVIKNPTKLAVFGIFFQITENEAEQSPFFKKYLFPHDLEKKDDKSSDFKIDFQSIFNLVFRNGNKLYTYEGSLTTPTCNEIVSWHVFKNPLKITKEMYHKFYEQWSNKHNEFIDGNNRVTMPLNGRQVNYVKICYSEILNFAFAFLIFFQLFVF